MEDVAVVVRAADFAAVKHRGQRRMNGDFPYINHPLGVARILTEEAGVTDATTLAAAILHDTLEDTDATSAELSAAFGAQIAAIVGEVSDDTTQSKVERKRQQIRHAPHLSAEARLVKLADKIYNLRDLATLPPPTWGPRRVRGYFCWAYEVVAAMGETDERLLAQLREIFAPEVPVDAAERATLLEDYYAELGGS